MKRGLITLFFICYTSILIVGSNLNTSEEVVSSFFVKATVYTTDPRQTDNTPYITASGFNLDSVNPKKHRIIAVSRDLKDSIGFGTKVRLENAGEYNGIYYVHDLMNKRFKKRIDILINPKDNLISLDSVKLSVIK